MELLKQSTSVTIKMGPFLDDTDGKTAETGLTISQADIRLSKNGGAFAQTHNATGATHDENGYYGVPLDTTDTGTLGRLRVAVAESGALPVWQDFMILPANVFDSIVSGSDYLDVSTVQVEGSDATDQINAACDTALSDYDAPTKAEMDSGFAGLNDLDAAGIRTALGMTSNDLDAQLDALPTAVEIRTEMDSNSTQLTAIVADTNELQGDWTDGGRLDVILDAILADTNELQTDDTPGALAAIDAKIDTIDGNVDSILTDTAEIGAAGAGLTAVPWNAAWDAEVQSECTDALNAYDPPTKAEMDSGFAGLNDITAADVWDSTSATLSLSFETMMDRMYQFFLNKMVITDATGAVALRNVGDSGDIMTNQITDNDTLTTRTAASWA